MWKPIYQPDPWPKFVKRKDIIGLPLMEQRRKFMEEQILFENYVSSINTVNTVSTAAAGAAGGPAPSTGGGGDEFPGIKLKIDTQYNFPESEYGTYNQGRGITTEDVFMMVGKSNNSVSTVSDPFEVTIDWGDGNVEEITSVPFFLDAGFGQKKYVIRHTYATAGEYDIIITGPGAYDVRPSLAPIVDVTYFKVNGWQGSGEPGDNSLEFAFYQNNFQGMSEATKTIISNWDTSQVSRLDFTFAGIDQFKFWNFRSASEDTGTFTESLPNVENWDVSNVENLSLTFSGRAGFSQNLGTWDVSNVQKAVNTFQNNLRLMSGARADLWNFNFQGQWYQGAYGTFEGSMTDPSVVGSMPHIGNWNISNIPDGSSNYFFSMFKDSGFSHTAVGKTLIGWASQSVVPNNIGVASDAFSNTWDGSGFSNPTYDTGSAFGAEVSASYDYLVTTKGWTIPNFTFS